MELVGDGRPQSTSQSLFEQEAPKIGMKCLTKQRVRERLNGEVP